MEVYNQACELAEMSEIAEEVATMDDMVDAIKEMEVEEIGPRCDDNKKKSQLFMNKDGDEDEQEMISEMGGVQIKAEEEDMVEEDEEVEFVGIKTSVQRAVFSSLVLPLFR
jgi:hypothetical protein